MANDYIGKTTMFNTLSKRFSRELIATIITAATMYYANNPYYIALKPVITVFGKWLREKYGVTWLPI